MLSIILAIIIIMFGNSVRASDEFMQVPAAIHISSTVSDGKLSIFEVVRIARQNNIKIVILTDRDFMRWQYGLWPLPRIIKKTVEAKSVSTFGIKRYLKNIEQVQKRNPDLVVIPGVESAPFYYWDGSPFRDNLKMYNWHKHILVIGLEKAIDYENLPTVSNGYSLALPFRFKNIYQLWPILVLMPGILCLRKRKFNYKDLTGHTLGPYSRPWQVVGVIIITSGLIGLLNNFPFCDFKYDQYHGEQGIGPYQNFIDYVNKKGGLTFWAHPEAENIKKKAGISIETRDHSYDLLEANGYTGFAIFYEGYKKIGCPGGIWDEVLREYCQGRRKTPVWAIGGLGFDQTGDLGRLMQDLRTVLLIPHLTKQAALNALKKGKMYVVRGEGSGEFILDKFIIEDSLSHNRGTIGDDINLKGKPKIKISAHYANEQNESVEVKLIRNGIVIKTFEVRSPFEIDYQDDYFAANQKIYYRIEIGYPNKIIITNPIFLKFAVLD